VASVREDEGRRQPAQSLPLERRDDGFTASPHPCSTPRDGYRAPANTEKGVETTRTKLRLWTAMLAILAVGLMVFGTAAANAGGKMA
jgi:hypothetical protein